MPLISEVGRTGEPLTVETTLRCDTCPREHRVTTIFTAGPEDLDANAAAGAGPDEPDPLLRAGYEAAVAHSVALGWEDASDGSTRCPACGPRLRLEAMARIVEGGDGTTS